MIDTADMERSLKQQIHRYEVSKAQTGQPRRETPKVAPPVVLKGLRVILGVKNERFAFEEAFEVQTDTISRIQAFHDAKRIARESGWKYISHVIDYIDPNE